MFINCNKKSISSVEIKNSNSCFYIFKSSSNSGSSGGPIINSKGDVIAINTGNYRDIGKKEIISNSNDKFEFDVKLGNKFENQDNYKLNKNFSIALSLQHPCLKSYFETFENSGNANKKKKVNLK